MSRTVQGAATIVAVTVAAVAMTACGSSPSSSSSPPPSSSGASAAAIVPTAAPETTAAATRKVTGKATTLGSGNFSVKDIPAGLYDVAAGKGETGNLNVTGADAHYIEILGGPVGVPKIRVTISDGDTIELSGLSRVTFTPVTTPFVTTHTAATLYAGTWTVGEDVGSGRYVAAPGAGQTGNFTIMNEGVIEILGGPVGVPNVTFEAKDGDVIDISGLSKATLTPA